MCGHSGPAGETEMGRGKLPQGPEGKAEAGRWAAANTRVGPIKKGLGAGVRTDKEEEEPRRSGKLLVEKSSGGCGIITAL